MPRGTDYTPELGDLICALIAEGQSLRKICKLDDMPHISTVLLWVLRGERGEETYKPLFEQYTRAREIQAEVLADEVVDIADDSSEDELFTEEGKRVFNNEFAARSKIKIDARKWYAGKVRPKKYGDKIINQHEPGEGVTEFTLSLKAKDGDKED